MPISVVEKTQTKSLPQFPVLASNKCTRVITKHFTNLYLYLQPKEVSFLGWLVYQVSADNTFKYNTEMIENYSFSLLAAKEVYKTKAANHDFKAIREVVKGLIEQGYILPTDEAAVFMLNPCLSYRMEYVSRREYKRFMEKYNTLNTPWIVPFTMVYRELINTKIKAKKNASKEI